MGICIPPGRQGRRRELWLHGTHDQQSDGANGGPGGRHAPTNVRLEIVTDSKNVIVWLSQGWKRNNPAIAHCV
jgi:hypothetical protein